MERISLNKHPNMPIVTVREHLFRYVYAMDFIVDKDVLDIACGAGYGMYLMSYWAKSVSGYDYKNEALNEAKGFNFKCDSLLEMRNLEEDKPLTNSKHEKFDIVTCFETIEHLENPDVLLNNIKNVVTDKFVFSFPNQKDLTDNNPWHKHAYNIETATVLMGKHFPDKKLLWFGQDQWGMSPQDLWKPYLVGTIII